MFGANNSHRQFRVRPAAYFPVPVLQNGIKLTTEPPKARAFVEPPRSARSNLQRPLLQFPCFRIYTKGALGCKAMCPRQIREWSAKGKQPSLIPA